MKRKTITLLLILLPILADLSAQVQPSLSSKFYFTHMGVEDGLAQNTVWCILQDHLGFMWFGTKDGLARYDGYKFRNFRYDADDPASLGNNFIRSLYEDGEGYIWVGTNAGVYIYDPQKENFSKFDVATTGGRTISREVNTIICGPDGKIWFGVNWQGLFCYNPTEASLTLYEPVPGDDNSISSINVWALCFDADGNLWVGGHNGGIDMYDRGTGKFINYTIGNDANINTIVRDGHDQLLIGTSRDGIYTFNPYLKTAKPMFEQPEYEKLFVRNIFVSNSNEIIIGTENGIYIYNYSSKRIQHIVQELGNPYSLSCKVVYSIYRDKEGAIWFGTYFGGVNYLPPPSVLFEKFYPTGNSNQLGGKAVREFIEDDDGMIWIGTEDRGLNKFDPETGLFIQYNTVNSNLSYDNIHALYADEDNLYIGTFSGGLNIMNRKTGRIVNFRRSDSPDSLSDDSVFSIFRDRDGIIWVGMIYGLCIFDEETNSFSPVPAVKERLFIYDIYQGANGIIYFAAYNTGILCYNPYLDRWDMVGGEDQNLLKNVISINEDSSSKIWFGTEGMGMVGYNSSTGELMQLTTRDGLPNDVVYKVVEDKNRNLWVSTNQGLACYDPATGSIKVYTSNNGLTSDQFNYKSGMRDSNGKLYFGTINGFISFSPERFTVSNNMSPVIFTGLKLGDRHAGIGIKDSPLGASMPYTGKIRLRSNQSTFTIDFALLSYNASNRNRYRYVMRNYTDEWTQPNSNQSVTFQNVPAGKYVFEVQGANSDGIWNDQPARLEIEILPSCYASTPAYLLYMTLTILTIWLYVNLYHRKTKERNSRKIEEMERRREREEYEAKINFFTNITHEIRTPLSLIRGPYEQIIKQGIKPSDYKENIEIMGVNIDRLLQLSNQLLDIRKIESERFTLNKSNIDLNLLVEECMLQFSRRISQKNLEANVSLPAESIIAHADREVLTKIICNLLDNAVKYSKSRISLKLETSCENDRIVLTAANDGESIPVEYHEKIFEPFFQIKGNTRGGTGLGLPLIKHLIEQHGGKVSIAPQETFTSFVVELPWKMGNAVDADKQAASTDVDVALEEEVTCTEDVGQGGGCPSIPYRVLVVEDDTSMQDFLRGLLSQTYAVSVAGCADEAFEILNDNYIDLIISDIMMPEMNGFELCRFLKSRIDYSHIPVVILSAKSDNESKILGLDAGADAYVEKPFSGEYLIAQVATILANRQILKESFSRQPFSSTSSLAPNKADSVFLDKITEIVNENMSEPNFSVDNLAGGMAMSRSNLHRKIKGLLQMTPNDFMRLIKLRKAAELLSEGEYRVSEICYMTGFNSSSYFAKCFQKQFGVLPKEFVKQVKK